MVWKESSTRTRALRQVVQLVGKHRPRVKLRLRSHARRVYDRLYRYKGQTDAVPNSISLPVTILPQPDDVTCGPTALHAVYRFYGDEISLKRVVAEVPKLEEGGTLAVHLGCHALERGYQATINTVNLLVFDPTWFASDSVNLASKLAARRRAKRGTKLQQAIGSYLRFLELGGKLAFAAPTEALLAGFLLRGQPVLTGLSGTYLYLSSRERDLDALRSVDDDVAGDPQGHFVVICGYDEATHQIEIADPYMENPLASDHHYRLPAQQLITAILLGVLTYDANILVIE